MNQYVVSCLIVLGKIGVNGYILITGYYMIKSKMTINKLIKLAGQVWFYSIMSCILFMTIIEPENSIGIKTIIRTIFPIIFSNYWFATIYIIVLILSPFFNDYLKSISKKQYFCLLCICLTFWSIIPTITTAQLGCSELIWFITMYLIAGYIRLHCNINSIKRKRHLMGFLIGLAILILSVCILIFTGEVLKLEKLSNLSTYLGRYNSILLVWISIEMFLVFISMRVRNNKYINYISSACFGVYLIHENEFVRHYLWHNIFQNSVYYKKPYFVLYALITILLIYVVCTIIDIIRQYTVEPIWILLIKKLEHSKYVPWLKHKARKIELLFQNFF